MLLRWNTPQYPRICPSTTTHCTHEPHTKMASIYPHSPPGPDPASRSDERAATRATRSSAATTPIVGPAKLRPGSIRGWRRTSLPPPDLWRPHRSPYNRYVRGRETAASRAKAATLTKLKRDLGKERIGHINRSEPVRLRQDACRPGRRSGVRYRPKLRHCDEPETLGYEKLTSVP